MHLFFLLLLYTGIFFSLHFSTSDKIRNDTLGGRGDEYSNAAINSNDNIIREPVNGTLGGPQQQCVRVSVGCPRYSCSTSARVYNKFVCVMYLYYIGVCVATSGIPLR